MSALTKRIGSGWLWGMVWGIFLVGGASPAFAEVTRVGIFPWQSADQSISWQDLIMVSGKMMSHIARQSEKYEIVRKYPLMGGDPPKTTVRWKAKRKEELKKLRQQLAQTQALIKSNKFEKAIEVLKKGIGGAKRVLRWKESFSLIARMYGMLSLSYLQIGRNDEGEKALKALASLNPATTPPEIEKNRIMKFRYKRAIKGTSRLPKGAIQVLGMKGARVYLNDWHRGEIPLILPQIPKGIHYLRVSRKGYLPWGGKIRVAANSQTQIKVRLPPMPRPKADPLVGARRQMIRHLRQLTIRDEAFHRAWRLICQKTGAEQILSGNIRKDAQGQLLLTPVRLDCPANQAGMITPIRLSTNQLQEEKLASLMSNMTARLLGETEAVRRPPPRTVERRTPARRVASIRPRVIRRGNGRTPPKVPKGIHQQWWFWTIIGVAVVGAGTTTAVLLLQPTRVQVSASWPTE